MPTNHLLITAALCLTLGCALARAQEEHDHEHGPKKVEKPTIFWTTPIAVQFQLRNLSNAELMLVDRDAKDKKYIPVWQSLLSRPGIESKTRTEAIDALTKLGEGDAATILVKAVNDASTEEGTEGVLYELGATLLAEKRELLSKHTDAFASLAAESQNAVARRIGYAGELVAGGSLDDVWQSAAEREKGLVDLLGSLPLIRDDKVRATFHSHVKPLVDDAADESVQAAAIEAMALLPGHEAEAFTTMASLIRSGKQRQAAIRALGRMDKARWPKDALPSMADQIIAYIKTTTPAERTEANVVDAVQLGNEIAGELPADAGAALRKTLRELAVTVVTLRTVPHEMRFERPYFAVEAGKAVQIVLHNLDIMPHNIVIVTPGSIEAVGTAAESLQPKIGDARPYIPAIDKVLFASQLAQPDDRVRLSFTAPQKPGEYGFVCTFPGHWRRMYGVMVVVDDLDAFLAHPVVPKDPLGNTRAFVKAWTMDDFATDLQQPLSHRNFERAQLAFKDAGCNLCHKMKGVGGNVGPELAEAFKKWKEKPADLLNQIIEPSKVVDDKYRAYIVETEDGSRMFGLVVASDDKTISVVTNPQNPVPQKVNKSEIVEQTASPNSLMPQGLLNIFTKDEILDLLAFIAAGGDSSNQMFAK